MKRKLYGNSIEASCEVCTHGKRSSDGNVVFCDKKGVVPLYYSCKEFIYNPLRRIPRTMPKIQAFSKEDFEL